MTELLDRNCVLEFDSLTSEYQAFFVVLLIHWLFSYRIDNGQRGELKHVSIFDEAKMVYAKERATTTARITQLTSQAREFCEGLVVSDQMPSALGEAIKANVFATVALNLSSMKDIQATSYAMGLSDEQRRCLISLPVGPGVTRHADQYTRPFILEAPKAGIVFWLFGNR